MTNTETQTHRHTLTDGLHRTLEQMNECMYMTAMDESLKLAKENNNK